METKLRENKQKIIRILEHFEVTYYTEGKNVSKDSINIQCPYCSDRSNHLGIFTDTMVFHCWRCNVRGPFQKLLCDMLNLSEAEANELVGDTGVDFKRSVSEQIEEIIRGQSEKEEASSQEKISTPPRYSYLITYETKSELFERFLDRRKISIETCIEHSCSICEAGKYMNRMIIPVFFQGNFVSFQAADMTGRATLKYISAPGNINNFLYNYDSIKKRMIVTEGILDCWRVGDDAVATFGTSLTERQKTLIIEKKLDELIFVWDSEAWWESRKWADFFRLFINKVRTVKLPNRQDPDSYGREETLKFIEECS